MTTTHISPYTYPGLLAAKGGTTSALDVTSAIRGVCDAYGVTMAQLKGRSALQQIALARHVLMFMLLTRTPMSSLAVGRFFGRHHTTVLSARDKIAGFMGNSPDFRRFVEDLMYDARTIVDSSPRSTQPVQISAKRPPENLRTPPVRPDPVYNNSGGLLEVKRKYL